MPPKYHLTTLIGYTFVIQMKLLKRGLEDVTVRGIACVSSKFKNVNKYHCGTHSQLSFWPQHGTVNVLDTLLLSRCGQCCSIIHLAYGITRPVGLKEKHCSCAI